jgi:hypothetical protein
VDAINYYNDEGKYLRGNVLEICVTLVVLLERAIQFFIGLGIVIPGNTLSRSLHSPGYSIWNPYGIHGFHPPFHGFHMDYFLAGSPAIFPFHSGYGIHMECPWNDAFHMDSMDQSMWNPYGIHGIPNEFQT